MPRKHPSQMAFLRKQRPQKRERERERGRERREGEAREGGEGGERGEWRALKTEINFIKDPF